MGSKPDLIPTRRALGLNRRTPKLRELSVGEAHWVAGLLEGEGCFFFDNRKTRGMVYTYPRIACNMTDRDVIERLHATLGTGTMNLKPPQSPRHKMQYAWRLAAIDDIEALVKVLYPLMGERRRARLDDFKRWYASR